MTRFLTAAGLALLLLSATPATAADIDSRPVFYHAHNGTKISGYLAEPAGPGPFPAVILIHEWWGLNDDIRLKTRHFAQQGYVALAVDLYDGEVTASRDRASQLAGGVRQDREAAFANLRAAIALLKTHANVKAERMATVGWCFGGGWALEVARNNLGVRASIIYYGPFNPADDFSTMRAAILGHFAEKDRSIDLEDVQQLEVVLKSQGVDHALFIYPNTTHGFASRPQTNPGYTPKAAYEAWQRTLAFLQRTLKD